MTPRLSPNSMGDESMRYALGVGHPEEIEDENEDEALSRTANGEQLV
ncbi:MAG: hypothetical protein WBZ19_29160 [Chthoniobacterales bacterium]